MFSGCVADYRMNRNIWINSANGMSDSYFNFGSTLKGKGKNIYLRFFCSFVFVSYFFHRLMKIRDAALTIVILIGFILENHPINDSSEI